MMPSDPYWHIYARRFPLPVHREKRMGGDVDEHREQRRSSREDELRWLLVDLVVDDPVRQQRVRERVALVGVVQAALEVHQALAAEMRYEDHRRVDMLLRAILGPDG